jgi:hypothetical protein
MEVLLWVLRGVWGSFGILMIVSLVRLSYLKKAGDSEGVKKKIKLWQTILVVSLFITMMGCFTDSHIMRQMFLNSS